MKKSLIYILIIVILLSACGNNRSLQNDKDETIPCVNCGADTCLNDKFCSSCGISLIAPTKPTHTHKYSEATCTESAKCTCGLTNGQELGHNYVEGVCSRCGSKDSIYVKRYSVGESWIVDGKWEVTINSVTVHHLCNSYENEQEGYADEQTVIIDYTYKNIGYTGRYGTPDDLYISASSFYVYDETGETAKNYGCTHANFPKSCIVGTKCTAQEAFVLSNNSSKITLVINENYYTLNGRVGEVRAYFELPINEITN